MRKATLATTTIAIVAVSLAFGVAYSDQIKAFFKSEEIYGNRAEIAEATPAQDAPLSQTADATTPSTDEQAANTTSDMSTTADVAMTPIDNGAAQNDLNAQAPSAGEPKEVMETAEMPAEETQTTEAAPATETTEAAPAYKVDVAAAMAERSIGSASAPITVEDFSSLTCPHCGMFHKEILPQIKEKYIDTGKVRWVFHGFPLNDPALKGEMVARCAPGDKDQYVKIIDLLFANQERWAFEQDPIPSMNMLLKVAGVTNDVFLACANNKELETAIVKNAEEASTKYKINSTPTFVLNKGLKQFAGAGTYKGFAYDLDRILIDLGQEPVENKAEKIAADRAMNDPKPSEESTPQTEAAKKLLNK